MSVSIIVGGSLWGLIACHHTERKLVPYEVREMCKHLGQILGQQIKAREEALVHVQTLRLTAVREEILAILADQPSVAPELLNNVHGIRRLLPADGAAVVFRDQVSRAGHAPDVGSIGELAQWLLRSPMPEPFATSSLVQEFGPAEACAAEASGLVATVVDREEPIVLLWFRAEQIETINRAGNPHKPVEPGEEPGVLTPRKSFEIWKDTVRNRSGPSSATETDAARRFGRAVFALCQQNTLRDLNVQLRRILSQKETLLAQKDLLMQEVNHRVQNSLQLVTSMLHLQARQTSHAQVKEQLDEASRRIMAVSTVNQRLWRSDHIQSVDFGLYLEELREGLLQTWGSSWAEHITIDARQVLIPTTQAVVLALVVTELLTNAVKYAYAGKRGPIHVSVREDGRTAFRVVVQDQGIGIQADASSGLGTRLVRSLVDQLGGELEVLASSPGTSFVITVPLHNGTPS